MSTAKSVRANRHFSRRKHRRFSRRLSHWIVYCLTMIFMGVMVKLPVRLARRWGGWLGLLAFYVLRTERRKVLNNLDLAYGDSLSSCEKKKLGQTVFRNAGMGVTEAAYLTKGNAGDLLAGGSATGMHHITEATKAGRGVVMVTAHYGPWEIAPPYVAQRISCKLAAVARELSNPHMDALLSEMRTNAGLHVFTRGKTGREYIRYLRQGNVLGVLADIDTGRGDGIFVEYFGRPAWTQTGVARLALIGKAAMIPVFVSRDTEDPGKYLIEVHPPLPEPDTEDEQEWIAQMTQALTREIEQAVRKRPDQWMWMHRRWRHQPARKDWLFSDELKDER